MLTNSAKKHAEFYKELLSRFWEVTVLSLSAGVRFYLPSLCDLWWHYASVSNSVSKASASSTQSTEACSLRSRLRCVEVGWKDNLTSRNSRRQLSLLR